MLLCPTEEDSGMLMSSVYMQLYIHIGGKKGKRVSAGAGEGFQIRQLTLEKGPAEMGIHSLVQGAAILSKGIFLFT